MSMIVTEATDHASPAGRCATAHATGCRQCPGTTGAEHVTVIGPRISTGIVGDGGVGLGVSLARTLGAGEMSADGVASADVAARKPEGGGGADPQPRTSRIGSNAAMERRILQMTPQSPALFLLLTKGTIDVLECGLIGADGL